MINKAVPLAQSQLPIQLVEHIVRSTFPVESNARISPVRMKRTNVLGEKVPNAGNSIFQ
jgi:hypothetical protein